MSIDLGLNRIYYTTFFHFDRDREYQKLNDDSFREPDPAEREKYWRISQEIREAKTVINAVRCHWYGRRFINKKQLTDDQKKYLDDKKAKSSILRDVWRDRSFWAHELRRKIGLKVRSTIREHAANNYDWACIPGYCEMIDNYISFENSCQMLGVRYKKDDEPPSIIGTTVDNVMVVNKPTIQKFKNYRRIRANALEDYAKKASRDIANLAIKNGVDIVVGEELTNSGSPDKSKKTRGSNRNTQYFAFGLVKKYLTNMLRVEGIFFDEVNEIGTSRVHPETGNPVYRSEKDNTKSYYLNGNGKVKEIDADLVGSWQIALNFLTRYANIYKLTLVKSEDGKYYVANFVEDTGKKDKEEGGKRLKGALTKLYNGYKVPITDIVPSEKEKDDYYRVNGKWVSRDGRDKYVNDIKSMVDGK
jgi:IS605 OrfB family transposase